MSLVHDDERTKMHVVLTVPGYPPQTHSGGIGMYGKLAAQGFSEAGHTVTVLSRALGGSRRVEHDGKVTVIRLPGPLEGPPIGLSTFSTQLHEEWCRVNVHSTVDYTECSDWGGEGVELLRRSITGVLATRVHSPGFLVQPMNPESPDYLSRETLEAEREQLVGSPHVLVNSAAAATALGQVGCRGQIHVVPYIYTTRARSPLPSRSMDYFRLGSVGRLERRKGADLLVEALRLLGPGVKVQLVLVGADTPTSSGTFSDALLASAPEWLAARILFMGERTHSETMNLIAGCHAVAQPARFENFAFSMLEPMSIGRPVILPDLRTLDAMTTHEDALTFEPESVVALASRIRYLTELSVRELSLLGVRHRAFYNERFASEEVRRNTLATVRKLVVASSSPAFSVGKLGRGR
jgi:glycosyltransferase involved in cell wall biosynthesis